MQNVREYLIAKAHNPEMLALEVGKLIKKGYQPWGNLSSATAGYLQPMVKYGEAPPEEDETTVSKAR